jgi:hypothetical protein
VQGLMLLIFMYVHANEYGCVCFGGQGGMKWDRAGSSFFGVFGRASSVIVNEYSLEMLDDSVSNIFTDELSPLIALSPLLSQALTSLRDSA